MKTLLYDVLMYSLSIATGFIAGAIYQEKALLVSVFILEVIFFSDVLERLKKWVKHKFLQF